VWGLVSAFRRESEGLSAVAGKFTVVLSLLVPTPMNSLLTAVILAYFLKILKFRSVLLDKVLMMIILQV